MGRGKRQTQIPLTAVHGRRRAPVLSSLQAPASMEVAARIRSDDRALEERFDATEWLEQASDEALVALAHAGFRGARADDVAFFLEGRSREVKRVLEYVRSLDADLGFECSLDQQAAAAWIARYRPWLRPWIRREAVFASPSRFVVADTVGPATWHVFSYPDCALVGLYKDEEEAIACAREQERVRRGAGGEPR